MKVRVLLAAILGLVVVGCGRPPRNPEKFQKMCESLAPIGASVEDVIARFEERGFECNGGPPRRDAADQRHFLVCDTTYFAFPLVSRTWKAVMRLRDEKIDELSKADIVQTGP